MEEPWSKSPPAETANSVTAHQNGHASRASKPLEVRMSRRKNQRSAGLERDVPCMAAQTANPLTVRFRAEASSSRRRLSDVIQSEMRSLPSRFAARERIGTGGIHA